MRKIAAAFLALALSPAISSASQDADTMNAGTTARSSAQTRDSRVYVVKGDVFVSQGKNPAHRVTGNEVIVSDTLIRTDNVSAALLKFEDGQIVTMQANSIFRVREYRYDANKVEDSSIIFSMLKGGLRFVTGLIGQRKKQAFRLLTPNATLGIRGTDFMVAMVDNSMYTQVQSGKITMTNPAGVVVLGAGKSAVVASSGALATMVTASAVPAGTFSGLGSIPLDPSAIPAPALESVSIPEPVPVPAPIVIPAVIPEPEPPVSVSTQAAEPPPEVIVEQPAGHDEPNSRSGAALTGKISSLGFGAELNLSVSDSVSTRFGINYGSFYSSNTYLSNYDSDVKLQTASAMLDWYPFQGSFRTTGGVFYNNNQVGLNAVPVNGNFSIGNGTYSTTQVSSVQGTTTFNAVAPYLGIGWGNPVESNKGWGLVSDFGVLFQGSPSIDMVATCPGACPGGLQNDLQIENASLQNEIGKFKLWPVVSVGISYQW